MNDPLHLGNSLWHLSSMRMHIIYQVGRLTLKLKNWEFILLKLAASQDDFYFSIFKLFVSCRSISKGVFAYDVTSRGGGECCRGEGRLSLTDVCKNT